LDETLDLIQAQGARMSEVARRDPDRPIPQYPGWSMSDLVAHTGSVLGRTTVVCRESRQERPETPQLPAGADATDWFDDQLAQMLGVLSDADPATVVWGFGSQPSVGFWKQRMLIEVGVHRFDAERAWGDPDPLTDEVAIAGLDEFDDMWLPRLGEVPTIRVHAADVDRSWDYGEGDPEAEISGTASDLYLRLMLRPAPIVLPTEWADALASLSTPAG